MIRSAFLPPVSVSRHVRGTAFVLPFRGKANRVAYLMRGVVPSEPSYEGVRHG